MNIHEQTIRSINPSEGKVLTQAAEVPIQDRVFTSLVILGKNETMYSWKEITIEEMEELKKEKERVIEEINSKAATEIRIAELEAELKTLKNE